MDDQTWVVAKTDTSESAIASANTVFTISNGYLALKGNVQEHSTGAHPTTFVNGVFDQADMVAFIRPTRYERRYLDPEYFDDATPSPSIANLPDPLFVEVYVDGRKIGFRRGGVHDFRQAYDLRAGVYSYEYVHEAPDGRRTQVRMERLCDMRNVHRAALRYSVTPLNYSGGVAIHSGIDGRVRSNLQNERQFEVLEAGGDDEAGCFMHARTLARAIDVWVRTADIVAPGTAPAETASEDEAVYNVYRFDAPEGEAVTIEKHIVLSSSEDVRHGAECDAREELKLAADAGFDAVLESSRAWWTDIWDRIDVRIEGDNLAQLYLRFCLFHLMSAAPRHTDKLSVPCKLLTGEHYQGTTFYDTDLYTESFYAFTFPEIARTCLHYRFLGLEPARRIARGLGYKGAKFAWQAGPYGEEALGRWWRFTHTNIHIDGDVAYSLVRYWRATGDTRFMLEKGIDILVESSRFYASRAAFDSQTGRYDLDDVAGPDEGHCESKNNFYTNLLAKKTLLWAAETLDLVRREHRADYDRVVERLSIEQDEPQAWRAVADGLTFYFDPKTKIYEQCEGFYELAPVPEDFLQDRRAWFETVFPYQALNQPDVVMGMVLLQDDFPEDVRKSNWEFYRDKSMSFSSMSFVINSIMAKDVGDLDYAYRQFLISAGEDLDEDLTGRRDTADGIHGTASGGAWMAAVQGFGGVRIGREGLTVDPRLPAHWKSLKFNLVLHGEVFAFDIDGSRVMISAGTQADVEMDAVVAGRRIKLKSGGRYEIPV